MASGSRASQNSAEAAAHDWRDLQNVLPQDFVQGLSSNRPPSRAAIQYAEAARVNPTEFLKAAKERASELDGQIKKLQAEKDILADEPRVQATLTTTINLLTSPIRRLPADIIREIVHHAAQDEYIRFDLIGTTVALSRVCSLWRTVVLSSPRLWSTLYLRITISHKSVMRWHRVIQAWFGRAGAVPLRLFLFFRYPEQSRPGTKPDLVIKPFLKSLAPWTSRIVHFGIGGSLEWTSLMVHFAGVEWSLPSLQRFDILGPIHIVDDDELEDDMAPLASVMDQITLFRDSNLMTTLVAEQEISACLKQLTLFPWSQMTNIFLEEHLCEDHHAHELLKLCPLLRRASLCVDARWINTLSTLVHRGLEVLHVSLRTQDCNQVVDFFRPYRFPNLSTLWMNLAIEAYNPGADLDSNGNFRKISPFPSLRALHIGGQSLSTSIVAKFLGKSPRLQTLHLNIYEGSHQPFCDVNELCQFMTLEPGQDNAVKCLEECSFYYQPEWFDNPDPYFVLDMALIRGFVQSRTDNMLASSNTLKKVAFLGGFRALSDVSDIKSLDNVLKVSSLSKVEVKPNFARNPLKDLKISSFLERLRMDEHNLQLFRG